MISFHTTPPLSFNITEQQKKAISHWLASIISKEQKKLLAISYIFCTDEYLHQINVQYLQHNTYTDIITFDNADETNEIEADIFISIDRVKDNAQTYKVSFENELLRVIAHGVLHLIGYNDKNKEQAAIMRQKENEAIALYKKLI